MAHALMRQLPHDAELFMDPYSQGAWPNIKRAWMAQRSGCTHRLVLEEDVELCPHFVEAATRAIAARPNDVIDFFAIKPGIVEARAEGKHWVSYGARAWGPAMAMPMEWGPRMVAWADETFRPEYRGGDARILLWAASQGRRIYATAPSLVQHRADASPVDLTVSESNASRQSPWVAGEEARDIDWSGDALDMPGLWRLAGMRRKYFRERT